ncbi:hypothetical protein LNK15_14545, partial [Jeotgalicoccus huakuii]|nr:hypothetical protein [Jeotgalicoccus huakuii]
DIHDQEVYNAVSRSLNALGGIIFLQNLEFFAQLQLFDEDGTEIFGIVHNQYRTAWHACPRYSLI